VTYRQITNRKTVRRFRIRRADKCFYLVETKSKVPAATNKTQAMNLGASIDPTAICGAAHALEQAFRLIVAHCGHSASRSLSGFADTHARHVDCSRFSA